MSALSDVTIGISSFLRAGYLAECLKAIDKHLPECGTLVVDDSGSYFLDHVKRGTFDQSRSYPIYTLPFDAGLSRKRNESVRRCRTKYFLLYCDDFKADEECRAGVERMIEVLDGRTEAAVAGGRVDSRPYECFLEYKPGEYIRELRPPSLPHLHGNSLPARVDLTANYFLARTELIRDIPWEDRCRIGGEHGLWFIRMKQAGRITLWVPGVNVKTIMLGASAKDPRYDEFRGRAYEQGHKVMKEILDIRFYRGMAGDVS